MPASRVLRATTCGRRMCRISAETILSVLVAATHAPSCARGILPVKKALLPLRLLLVETRETLSRASSLAFPTVPTGKVDRSRAADFQVGWRIVRGTPGTG